MANVRAESNVPREQFGFEHIPETDQSFENALERARNGDRLTVADGVELLTTGTDQSGIDLVRKERVLEAADRRREEVVGDTVTFVANLNNNVTTACNTGCLFCNFKNTAQNFEVGADEDHGGFTKTPDESREIVADARERGIYEVTSVSGLHPGLALDDEHLELLDSSERGDLNYKRPDEYTTDPATYVEQIRAMSLPGIHVHSMTPEEAYHARRGTDWGYEEVFRETESRRTRQRAGHCRRDSGGRGARGYLPRQNRTDEWMEAMEAAANVGLDTTATIMYGHVENEMHRILHFEKLRDLQDRTGAITEFVPLSFIHQNTPLYDRGMVETGASITRTNCSSPSPDSSWTTSRTSSPRGSSTATNRDSKCSTCGANDFMGTILSEEITKRAGGQFGEFRSFEEYVEMITAIGRTPAERSTDYKQIREIDPNDPPFGPTLGPCADGTPLLD